MKKKDARFGSSGMRTGSLLTAWVLLLLFNVLFLPQAARGITHKNNVLVLHSYHQGLVWTDDIMEGIYSVFGKGNPEVELHIEYMDTKRHFDGLDGEYLTRLLEIYRSKYNGVIFDAIISSDDNALRFLLLHHEELFPDTPVVFCGINDYADTMLVGHKDFTGVLEVLDQEASIDIALRLHPGAEQVAVITDTSTTGKANRVLLEKLAQKYRDRAEFVFLDGDGSGLTRQELLEKLMTLPEKSIVYYSDFLRNTEGYVDQETLVPEVSRESERPVYTHYDEILGLGVVGGKLVDGHSHGRKAAEIARDIMEGTPVSEIPVYKESINRYMFDHTQLERFGIAESDLPEDSIVVNKPSSAYEKYKKTIWTGGGIIGSLSVLVVFLAYNIARRKSTENELREAHNFLEQRVEERTRELSESNRMLHNEISGRQRVENALKESEKHYRSLFDDSPLSIWENDFSDVKVYLDGLKNKGIKDFRDYLESNPDEVARCAGMVRITDVNRATLTLYEAESREALLRGLENIFVGESYAVFREELIALAEGKGFFECEAENQTLKGRRMYIALKTFVLPGYEETLSKVIAAIIDITGLKNAEEALREKERELRTVVSHAPLVLWSLNEEGVFTLSEGKGLDILGLKPREVVGRSVFDVYRDSPQIIEETRRALSGESFSSTVELGKICFDVRYETIRDTDGRVSGITGIATDITERTSAEKRIKDSLREKEILLREIHHRVKNNLNVTISLLRLQSRHIEDDHVLRVFQDAQGRIKAMARVHEKLYQSDDFTRIDIGDYVRTLADDLFQSYHVHRREISLEVSVGDVSLGLDSLIPCGLILNELVSNSIKHAFKNRPKGRIRIEISGNGTEKVLVVGDDGTGLPGEIDVETAGTLGLTLVSSLVFQLQGALEVDRTGGTTYRITFRERNRVP